jgi:hypothetical protein
MEVKGSSSIYSIDKASDNIKVASLQLNGLSRRHSTFSSAMNSYKDCSQSNNNGRYTPISPSKFFNDSNRAIGRRLSIRNSVDASEDLTSKNKKEFGDSRPLVKNVWNHYPEMEIPLPQKGPREKLNTILDRPSKFGNKAPQQDTHKSASEENSLIEVEEDTCEKSQRFPNDQLRHYPERTRPTSAQPRIDSITKLRQVDNLEDENDPIIRERLLAKNLEIQNKEQEMFDVRGGKFLRPDSSQKAFKISSHLSPKGVLNERIWKQTAVSPHIDLNSKLPPQLEELNKHKMFPFTYATVTPNCSSWKPQNYGMRNSHQIDTMPSCFTSKNNLRNFSSRNGSIEPRKDTAPPEKMFNDKMIREADNFNQKRLQIVLKIKKKNTHETTGTDFSQPKGEIPPDYSKIDLVNAGLIEELSEQYLTTPREYNKLAHAKSANKFKGVMHKRQSVDHHSTTSQKLRPAAVKGVHVKVIPILNYRKTVAGTSNTKTQKTAHK